MSIKDFTDAELATELLSMNRDVFIWVMTKEDYEKEFGITVEPAAWQKAVVMWNAMCENTMSEMYGDALLALATTEEE